MISLDETTIGRFMISMPLVTSPLIGWILGEPAIGLSVGFLWQLVWINYLPVGVNTPPSYVMMGVLAPAFATFFFHQIDVPYEAAVIFGILVTLPLVFLNGLLDAHLKEKNHIFVRMAEAGVAKDRPSMISWAIWLNVTMVLVKNALIYFIALGCLTSVATNVLKYLPDHFIQGMKFSFYLVPGIGLATVFDLFKSKENQSYFLTALVISLFLIWLFHVAVSTLLTISILCGFLLGLMRYILAWRTIKT